MKNIGLLTIGQSPRTDILSDLEKILGDQCKIVESGALDELSLTEIMKLKIESNDNILVTRMRDGTEVKITKKFVVPLMQKKITELEEKGVKIIVIMCTGKFPRFNYKGIMITPKEIIKGVLKGSIKEGKLGIVYPAKEQIKMAHEEFGRDNIQIYADHLSPYVEENKIEELTERLVKQDLDLILLNCFGYTSNIKNYIAKKTRKPVILSNTLMARIIKEIC